MMFQVYLWIVLAPLIGALVAGLFGRVIGRAGAHRVTIAAVAVSTALSAFAYYDVVVAGNPGFDGTVYTWGVVGDLEIPVGFLIDELSVTMMVVVTFVSLMVHVYTIGYMRDDPGYQRFFSYISLFTFAMLMLVTSNNFMQLFFGWEAVGVVSYLLIGFWFDRESAIRANLKAFLVNRVGDFGFLLGIACLFTYFGSLHYDAVFAAAPGLRGTTMAAPGAANGRCSPSPASACSSGRWANPRSSRCTSGCRIRWRVRPRSPPSSTPPPWSPPASSWWRGCRRCSSSRRPR